jgi:hypothetical protein
MKQAADRQAEEALRLEEEERERRLDAVYAAVAQTPDGEIVLRDLVKNYGAKTIPFTNNSKKNAYNIGMAHACNKLVERLERCLTREKFIDIVYPAEKQGENNGRQK